MLHCPEFVVYLSYWYIKTSYSTWMFVIKSGQHCNLTSSPGTALKTGKHFERFITVVYWLCNRKQVSYKCSVSRHMSTLETDWTMSHPSYSNKLPDCWLSQTTDLGRPVVIATYNSNEVNQAPLLSGYLSCCHDTSRCTTPRSAIWV